MAVESEQQSAAEEEFGCAAGWASTSSLRSMRYTRAVSSARIRRIASKSLCDESMAGQGIIGETSQACTLFLIWDGCGIHGCGASV